MAGMKSRRAYANFLKGGAVRRLRAAFACCASVCMAAALCAGCSGTTGVSTMCDVPVSGWSEPASALYCNSDTTGLYTLSLAVRHDGRMCGSELHAEVRFIAPDSSVYAERAVFPLAERGRCASVSAVEKVAYRRAVRLARQGEYTIIITPEGSVRGIEAVGMAFDKE